MASPSSGRHQNRAAIATRQLGDLEDLGQVTRIGKFLPGLHLEHGRGRRRQERGMGRRRDLGHLAQELHVLGTMIKVVVATRQPNVLPPRFRTPLRTAS